MPDSTDIDQQLARDLALARARKRAAWNEAHTQELERRRLGRLAEREQRRAEHDEFLERRRQERLAEKEARREQRAAEAAPSRLTAIDKFEIDMAQRMGVTVEEFRELQRERREEMQDKPKISYAKDHKVKG